MGNAFLSGYSRRKYRGFVANDAVKANWPKLIVGYKTTGTDADAKVYLGITDVRDDFNDYALVRFVASANTRQKEWKEKHTSGTTADKWFKVTEAYSSVLTGDAAAAQAVVNVTDASGFAANDWVVITRDTGVDEFLQISSIATNAITMTANLANAYTTADNAKLMLGYYIYYDDADDATDYQDGANVFTVFDDFERGNDGDAIGGDWTIITGDVDISTGQAFGGTRAMKLIGAATAPQCSISQVHSEDICIRYRYYKEDVGGFLTMHSDGTWQMRMYHATDETWKIHDGAGYVKFVPTVKKDEWGITEIRDFDWTAITVDGVLDGVLEDDADFSYGNADHDDLITFYGVLAAGQDVWIDDFIGRNYPDIVGSGFGSMEAIFSVTAGLTASATIDRDLAWDRAVSAGLTISTIVTRVRNRTITAISNLTAAVTIVKAKGRSYTVNAGLTISTTISKVLTYIRASTSNLTASATVSRKAAWAKATSPALSISTTITRLWNRTITTSPNLTINAVVSRVVAWTEATTANLTASATVSIAKGFHKAVTAGLTASVTIVKAMGYTKTITAGIKASVSILWTPSRNLIMKLAEGRIFKMDTKSGRIYKMRLAAGRIYKIITNR